MVDPLDGVVMLADAATNELIDIDGTGLGVAEAWAELAITVTFSC